MLRRKGKGEVSLPPVHLRMGPRKVMVLNGLSLAVSNQPKSADKPNFTDMFVISQLLCLHLRAFERYKTVLEPRT